MTKETDAAPQAGGDIPDPNGVPITHVTGSVSNIANGQTILLNLVSDRMAIGVDGSVRSDLIIAARLRFDLNVARRIRDQLDAYLNGNVVEGPGPNQKLN